MKRNIQDKGITLVALVITIVILIILAVVAINFAFGDNGLISQAERARDYQANADATDSSLLNDATEYIDGIIGGNGGSGDDQTDNPREVEGVTIPEGFYYVGGSKTDGIVISDNESDLGKGTSHEVAQTLVGNQFVWIPVEDDSLFKRYEGYYNGSLHSILSSCTEPYLNGYTEEKIEYDAMIDSVLEHKGFYIGRYECGTISETERTEESGVADEVVVKQGKNVYNFIGWSSSDNMSDETGGAVEKSKNFASENGYSSVTSTLVYGIQWDAIMNWIDPAYSTGSCTTDSIVRNSTGRGFYEQSAPTITGSNENYMIKNIYDLAGNVAEWTMEAYNDNHRVIRGGDYGESGLVNPISRRNHNIPTDSFGSLGFRIALYIN